MVSVLTDAAGIANDIKKLRRRGAVGRNILRGLL